MTIGEARVKVVLRMVEIGVWPWLQHSYDIEAAAREVYKVMNGRVYSKGRQPKRFRKYIPKEKAR